MSNASFITLAHALNQRRGFALLDSALESTDNISILAWEPEQVICGNSCANTLANQLGAAGIDIDGSFNNPKAPIAIGALGFDGAYEFGIYQKYLVYHHDSNSWLPSLMDPNSLKTTISFEQSFLENLPRPSSCSPSSAPRIFLQPSIRQEEYESWVVRAKNYIASGDIYQVCLAYPWHGQYTEDPWLLYQQLRSNSPAPFGAFLRMQDRTLLSASPELFLRMEGRYIQTKPIKGTRPRSTNCEKDAAIARELITNEKERAELLMITDLQRNDLGKICDIGSIRVDKLIALEQFAQVHHLVSTISGKMRAEISHPEALLSCSPGGSITGAPKKRAIEIINEIEKYPRGYYTGSTGVIGLRGQSIFNINIRTLILQGTNATYFTGAGIVVDSSPSAEWEETLVKAKPIAWS